MEFKSPEDDQKEKLLKIRRIWNNKVNIELDKISHQDSGKKRLLEVVANTNPTLVPNGESPLVELHFLIKFIV